MTKSLLLLAWLAAVWVALWGELTWANLLGGLVVAAAVVALVPAQPQRAAYRFRPLAGLKLLFYFAWKLVEAALFLAWEVITPTNRVNAAVVAAPMRTRSPALLTFVGSLVSLTPGTVTIEADSEEGILYVHILHLGTPEGFRAEISRLERLALDAFPQPDRMMTERGRS